MNRVYSLEELVKGRVLSLRSDKQNLAQKWRAIGGSHHSYLILVFQKITHEPNSFLAHSVASTEYNMLCICNQILYAQRQCGKNTEFKYSCFPDAIV